VSPNIARDEEIVRLRSQGKTLAKIGDQFGIGPERVRQIVAKAERRAKRILTSTGEAPQMTSPDKEFEDLQGLTRQIDDSDLRSRITLAAIAYGSACALRAIDRMGKAWDESIKKLERNNG
jgi:hypothetical protein